MTATRPPGAPDGTGGRADSRRYTAGGDEIRIRRRQRGPTSITPQKAEAAIAALVTALPVEPRPLAAALGGTLRQDVFAERDNPPFDRVCMDGIAVANRALERGHRSFRITGLQRAGTEPTTLADPDGAIEVMTGAVLPAGTDCVIPVEEYEQVGDRVTLRGEAQGGTYRNVQRRGSDGPRGTRMLRAGVRLGAPELAVVASAGLAQVEISRQPAIAVVSTGDELIDPGRPIADHQVRRSNAYAIAAALRAHGFERLHDDHLLDDAVQLRERLARILAEHDVLVLSGGVSKGKFDLVPEVLRELGVREVFHRVAQRPGMPMWFGTTGAGRLVFGLPGNPVSTLICLVRYALPALTAATGATPAPPEPIALAAATRAHRALALFVPARVQTAADGSRRVVPHATSGSGDFLGLAGTDGFVELAPAPADVAAGTVVPFYRW